MSSTRIKLSALWVAVMLTYLLGDVLRIYAGDFTPGEVAGVALTQEMWLGVAIVLAVPIFMLVLTLWLTRPVNRWANVIAAAGLFAFNLFGLPTYPGAYDRFLIVVGLVLNVITVVTALRRVGRATPEVLEG